MSTASKALALADILRKGKQLPNEDAIAVSGEVLRQYVPWLEGAQTWPRDAMHPARELAVENAKLEYRVEDLQAALHRRANDVEHEKVRLAQAIEREDRLEAHIKEQNAVIGRLTMQLAGKVVPS